jgi:class 3 adenylate cyclase/tetratricopeptide (TPR) repeat protein
MHERKLVSVLFCDLVDFTPQAERQDPEDVQARLSRYHGRVRSEIEAYGGTVEKFIGDAVVAVFGAPRTHEDDAERAVRAGLAILEAVAELDAESPEFGVHVRVGVNTGEALVSVGANAAGGEGLAAGDVVNTAARIQAAAPKDAVAAGAETYRQTERVFAWEPLGPVALKGKAEPVELYRALEARGRFGSDLLRGDETPFVGRRVEQALLQGLFERAAETRSLQLVTLVGEPGVGKSRLVAELFRFVDERPELVTWRQGRCLAYGEGVTFWALGEIVKAHAGIYESDAADVASAKLEAVLAARDDRAWLHARLLPLLGIDSGAPAARDEQFAAWRRFVEGIAEERVTVVVVEDLHWADAALLDFLGYLADWAAGVPLLLVCSGRPELYERHATWGAGVRNATTINLAPLSESETGQLVRALADRRGLSEGLEQTVLERAGGNPLYAEELVRLLADGPADVNGDALSPTSVQALIAARLDTLTPERKRLLQDAAVVGKVFWAGALAAMGDDEPAAVELALHELGRKELVRPARRTSMEGEVEYAFWHALVRDVAYAQIPRADRARRHRAAAAWIERRSGDRVEDHAEILSHHYDAALKLARSAGDAALEAELAPPARRFLTLAGERALELDRGRAEERFEQALALTPPDAPERPELLLLIARVLQQGGRSREAAVVAEEALATGDEAVAVRALLRLASISLRLEEGRQIELTREALALVGDRMDVLRVEVLSELANASFVAGSYDDAIAAADQAAALATQLGVPQPNRALGYRGLCLASRGDARGLAEVERCRAALLESGASGDAATMTNNLAVAGYPLRGPAQTLATLDEGISFSDARGVVDLRLGMQAMRPALLAELGHPEEALAVTRDIAAIVEGAGDLFVLSEIRATEVALLAVLGRQDEAPVEPSELAAMVRPSGIPDGCLIGFTAAARLALALGRIEECAGYLAEVDQVPGVESTPYYARFQPELVRLALRVGQRALAARFAEVVRNAPVLVHARSSAAATLAEHDGRLAEAAAGYAEAAEGWQSFGNLPEHALALLGRGRTLTAMGHPDAPAARHEARAALDALGYAPAVAEIDALDDSRR